MKKSIASILISLVLSSCESDCTHSSFDEEKLAWLETLLQTIEGPHPARGIYYPEDLENKISSKDLKVLKEMDFHNIEIIENRVYVFTFGFEKFSSLNRSSRQADMCSYYLFYASNPHLKKKISYYEGYANCRVSYEELTPNWTLVVQDQTCED